MKTLKVFLVFVGLSVGQAQTFNTPWFAGGSLHQSRPLEWLKATYKNRLATAGDFTFMMLKFGGHDVNRMDMGELRTLADSLEICITEVAQEEEFNQVLIPNIADTCGQIIGFYNGD